MLQKRWQLGWLVLIFGVALVACGSQPQMVASREESLTAGSAPAPMVAQDMAYEMEMPAAEMDSFGGERSANTSAVADIPAERLIIRTGELDIVVSSTEESLDEIGRMADELGGWVVNSSIYSVGTADRGNILIRVPADKFEQAMNAIKEGSIDVNRESTSGQDVTEEFVDLSARLKNTEMTAERVRSFLDDARRVEDALAVNQELSRLEEQIEVLKGRMEYLSQSAAFSTISISLTPDALSQPIEVAGWRPQGIAKEAVEALIAALQGLANVVIWLVIFALPVLLVIGTPLYFIGRWIVRRWRARRQRRQAAES